MAIPLQKTKLFAPPARGNWVNRLRLTGRLDNLLNQGFKTALVSAPAGSGKTTLIVQWLSRQRLPVGWLSLDERDNLPARFFAYLIAALQEIAPGAGHEALPLLDLPGANPEEIITLLTNDLADAPDLFLLVLDDFHVISNPLLHQAVDFLIEAQPSQMRLVLLSREDPALQLARRRARGQLVELRQSDLSFTLEEAAVYLNQSMNLQLTAEQVQVLEKRTEGWAAGLHMASLALQGPVASQSTIDREAYIDRFLGDFSGNHRFVIDYLMEEVLARQAEEVQTFLLETAVLERMQVDLCAAVTGKTIPESQKLLEHISRANLFVIPLDEERTWYRYHHLFGDLLLARLRSKNPPRAAELYACASDWYEVNDEPRMAVDYALKAEDYQRAADLIDQHASERWQTVDIEFFKLVSRLPFEVIAERPSLCLQNAWLNVLFGQNERILPYVEAAERALERPSNVLGQDSETSAAASRAFARTLRSYVADLQNQPVLLDESLEMAYKAIPETNPGMRNSVGVIIGTICFMEGDFASAVRYFEDALALDKRVNGTNAVPIASTRICFVLLAQGQLREALRRLREAEAYVRERGIRRFYISGSLYQRMAEIYLEWDRLDEVEDRLQEGKRLLEDWPLPTTLRLGMALLVRLRAARGDIEGARSALEEADRNVQQAGLHPYFVDVIERARLRLFLAEQNGSGLEDWARDNEHFREKPLSFRYETRQVELCRAWLALGRVEAAVGLLERLAEAARERNGSRITILALLATALRQQPEKAIIVLDEALRLAGPEGYLRTFLEAGESLSDLLRLWLQHGPSRDDSRLRAYAQAVLSAFDRGKTGTATQRVVVLPEPLSQRELEVLSLVAKGLSNQQIADRLVISIRTVKKHVENIHGKLGVYNRTQAVVCAQQLGLIQ